MGKAKAVLAAVLATLACAGAVRAHHSGYMYSTTPIWIEGKVVSFEPRDPHTFTTLESTAADGTVRRWVVEGPGQSQLERMGNAVHAPQVGEVLRFCAHPYKEEWIAQFSSTDADGTPRQLIEGHVMLLPDGERRFWDPHGIISECMQSSDDQRQAWLDFLRAEPRALSAWCQQQAYEAVRTNAELSAYVAEIDGLLDDPCR
jgi:hypothetical protein